jgi:hypothetical protein
MPIKKYTDQKNRFLDWLALTPEERFATGECASMSEEAKLLGVNYQNLINWKKQYEKVYTAKEDEDGEYDSLKFLLKRNPYVDECLLKSCEKGNANSIKIFKQLVGQFVEKSEQKVKLDISAESVARRNIESLKQLRTGGYGVDEVQVKSRILHDKLCIPSGQGDAGDNQMATVGTPENSNPTPENTETTDSIQVETDRT